MTSRWLPLSLICCSAVAMATESLPTNPRLLFNHGAELAASGKLDEATDVLRHAAIVRDRTIAARALSLLGKIATTTAKQLVSENAAETPSKMRQIIFDHLQSAEQSFVESLSLQQNEEVRQHLETIRAWRHNMANVWDEYDRRQHRNSEFQQRIRWLADWEEKLVEKVRPMLEEPNSPRKFQVEYETGREQKKLAEELTTLQNVPEIDEKLKDKWELLPEMQHIADEATELLAHHRTAEALPKQQQVLDYLRSLLKQEQNQQNQNQDQEQEQEQEQDNQEQQNREQSHDQQSQQSDHQPQSSQQAVDTSQQRNEDPTERAERLLMQVRRKEQAAEQRREQIRALQMQADAVEKDW